MTGFQLWCIPKLQDSNDHGCKTLKLPSGKRAYKNDVTGKQESHKCHFVVKNYLIAVHLNQDRRNILER